MASSLALQDLSADGRPYAKTAPSRDEVLTSNVIAAIKAFEETINAASAAGLIVEAHVERVGDPAPDLAQGYVAKVKMHRKVG